jgi:hypothetical protein
MYRNDSSHDDPKPSFAHLFNKLVFAFAEHSQQDIFMRLEAYPYSETQQGPIEPH